MDFQNSADQERYKELQHPDQSVETSHEGDDVEALASDLQSVGNQDDYQQPAQSTGVEAWTALPRFVSTSLFIADLDTCITDESFLYDLFNQDGTVLSIKICHDALTGTSLGRGYVNFTSVEAAANALMNLNYTILNGKPMRLMFSNLDASSRYNDRANIFIKNLEASIDSKALHDTFSAFGVVLSCKVALDDLGRSKGFGFVQFEEEEAAQTAIEKLNGMLLENKQVYVGPFVPRTQDVLHYPSHYGNEGTNVLASSSFDTAPFKTKTSKPKKKKAGKNANRKKKTSFATQNQGGPGPTGLAADYVPAERTKVESVQAASSQPWAPQPWSTDQLSSALASALVPDGRSAMLGGTLFPLVDKLESDYTAEVTNVLVRLEIAEIMQLMEYPEKLNAKVAEVMKLVSGVNQAIEAEASALTRTRSKGTGFFNVVP